MFKRLRNRIIVIAMVVTTAVLVLSGMLIMVFSSATRPEPKPLPEPDYSMSYSAPYDEYELKDYIEDDRREGNERLFVTLLCVGAVIEISAFLIVYFVSQKIVEPVRDAYDKQKMFIANVSHELKTPLAIIQANMEALDVGKGSEKWKLNIENEISYANKLVLDLLQLARMDAGNTKKTAREEINMKDEMEKRVEMFRPKFAGRMMFRNSSDDKAVVLVKQDFLQVLDILLDNATKYGDKKVSVILEKNGFVISNDGVTISKDERERVFDRFYQADKSRDGSGLGLAIAKALCEQNNWRISCENGKSVTKFAVDFSKDL